MIAKKIIHNAFNYSGGKDRLIVKLQEHFPNDIKCLYEVFCGSGVVSLNTSAIRYELNDKNYKLIGLLKLFYMFSTPTIIDSIDSIIKEYELNKMNREGFLELRKNYNLDPITKIDRPELTNSFIKYIKLYCLIVHSFNYFIIFDKNGRYVNTSGCGRSYFNGKLRDKLITYIETLKTKQIEFKNLDFAQYLQELYKNAHSDSLVYCDCPYLITDDTYSRTPELKWTDEHEDTLYELLDKLHDKGIKFALSNVIEHNGVTNIKLDRFRQNYRTINLDMTYDNCNYQKKNLKSKEVLIINF